MLTEQDYIFDGFCHRPYDEKLDGWRNTQIGFDEFPILDMAQQIIEMGREINRLRRLVWEHEHGLSKLSRGLS